MFCKGVCLLLAFCDSISYALLTGSLLSRSERSAIIDVSTTHVKHPIRTQALSDELRLEQLFDTNNLHRRKRGIVLIDEDFNVSPEPGVKQGWSDGSSEKSPTKSDLQNIATPEEGSGTSIEEYSTTKAVDNPTSGKLQLTSYRTQLINLETTLDMAGSGDIPDSTASENPRDVLGESIPMPCLNSTCDSKYVTILPGLTETVPEGANLTISCIVANTTEHLTLRWYKHSVNVDLLIEASNQRELHLVIHQSQLRHSGTYLCVQQSGQSCCHKRLNIIVYQVPNYKYHLIIIGLVATVSLLACLLLGFFRKLRLKTYEVQKLESENAEKSILI